MPIERKLDPTLPEPYLTLLRKGEKPLQADHHGVGAGPRCKWSDVAAHRV